MWCSSQCIWWLRGNESWLERILIADWDHTMCTYCNKAVTCYWNTLAMTQKDYSILLDQFTTYLCISQNFIYEAEAFLKGYVQCPLQAVCLIQLILNLGLIGYRYTFCAQIWLPVCVSQSLTLYRAVPGQQMDCYLCWHDETQGLFSVEAKVGDSFGCRIQHNDNRKIGMVVDTNSACSNTLLLERRVSYIGQT